MPKLHDATISIESITRDLEHERPIWPLSTYGPAKYQPTLMSGLDDSPEELRVKSVEAARSGTTQDYVRPPPFLHDVDFPRRQPARHRSSTRNRSSPPPTPSTRTPVLASTPCTSTPSRTTTHNSLAEHRLDLPLRRPRQRSGARPPPRSARPQLHPPLGNRLGLARSVGVGVGPATQPPQRLAQTRRPRRSASRRLGSRRPRLAGDPRSGSPLPLARPRLASLPQERPCLALPQRRPRPRRPLVSLPRAHLHLRLASLHRLRRPPRSELLRLRPLRSANLPKARHRLRLASQHREPRRLHSASQREDRPRPRSANRHSASRHLVNPPRPPHPQHLASQHQALHLRLPSASPH